MSGKPDTHIDGLPTVDWYLIPESLVSELSNVPVQNFVGQAVLLRNDAGMTAMVTIAEAAHLQLDGLIELLECLFEMIATTPGDRYRGGLLRAFHLKWLYKAALACSLTLHTTWATEEVLLIGFAPAGEKTHWLAMDLMLLLGWISAITDPLGYPNDPTHLVVREPKGSLDWSMRMNIENRFDRNVYRNILAHHGHFKTKDAGSEGCWRKKITGGVLLGVTSSASPSITIGLSNIPGSRYLALTAGALWSLFDHRLRQMPGCTCTLRTGESEFLTCEKREGEIFFWHLETDPQTICEGRYCTDRVPITLDGPDKLHFNSQCLLGWVVNTRDSPHDRIASHIMPSDRFLGRKAVTYTPRAFELQMQLGYSGGGATAVALTGVTFDMTRYTVSNSIPHGTLLATALSEMATILVYCETRKIHLAMHGADLVESICVQLVQGLNPQSMPSFIHPCALERMRTWRESTFVTGSDLIVPGVEIVQHACDRLQQFMAQSKSYHGPLYWNLQGMVAGTACAGVRPPRKARKMSWYRLSEGFPILIVAVNTISDKLLEPRPVENYSYLERIKHSFQTALIGFGISKPNVTPFTIRSGGILSDNALIETLLRQAYNVYPARPVETSLHLFDGQPKCFRIKADETLGSNEIECAKCSVCRNISQKWPLSVCLHYFG